MNNHQDRGLRSVQLALEHARKLLEYPLAPPPSEPEDDGVQDGGVALFDRVCRDLGALEEKVEGLADRQRHFERALEERVAENAAWRSRLLAWESMAKVLESSLARLSADALRSSEEVLLAARRDALVERFGFAYEESGAGSRSRLVERFGRVFDRLDLLSRLSPEERAKCRVVDIDCFRGEWLETLVAAGFGAAHGFDASEEMVLECRRRGLAVVRQEAVRALSNLADASARAISALRLGKDAKLGTFLLLANEAKRVLEPGGYLLLGGIPPGEVRDAAGSARRAWDTPLTRAQVSLALKLHGFRERSVAVAEDASCQDGSPDAADARPWPADMEVVVAEKA